MKSSQTEAIELMYDKFSDSLYGIALSVLKNEEEAQDVVQESFIKGWRKLSTYDPLKGTLFTWLLNITRNTAIDKLRTSSKKRESEIQITESIVGNAEGLSFNPDFLDLRKHLGNLEVKYQEIIDALFFQGMTQQEASDELGIPLGTVKTRYKIAMRELRKVFVVALIVYMIWQIS
tara:strand:- start:8261 stop:8788 length:528 start_codon:yes stop_codon:yes gene_type:complete